MTPRHAISFFTSLLSLGAFIIVWSVLAFSGAFRAIPTPWEVLKAAITSCAEGELFVHSLFSLSRVLAGFCIGCSLGVLTAILLKSAPYAARLILPIIELMRPIPPIAWIPLSIALFGYGNASAVYIVFLSAFFPTFTAAYAAFGTVPAVLKDAVASFQLSRVTYFWRFLLPCCLPGIFNGLNISLGTAWMSVVAAELIASQEGLGYLMMMSRLTLRTDKVVLGMFVVGVLGVTLMWLLRRIERYALPWQHTFKANVAQLPAPSE